MTTHATITGTGAHVPDRVVTNADLSGRLGEDIVEFVSGTLGIRERRICGPDDSAADLAEAAGRRALEAAGVDPGEVDLLVGSTDTPEYVSPATSSVVQHRLGLSGAGTFDVNCACAGFVTALDVGWKYLRAHPAYRRILVVATYAMSKFLDWDDKDRHDLRRRGGRRPPGAVGRAGVAGLPARRRRELRRPDGGPGRPARGRGPGDAHRLGGRSRHGQRRPDLESDGGGMSSAGRVVSGGPLALPEVSSVTRLFRERAEDLGDRPALRSLAEGGAVEPRTMSWSEWGEESRAVTAALVADGLEAGDAVAILAGNRSIWPVSDLGVVGARGLSVGLYPTSAPAQIREVLADCGARVAVVDTAERLERLLSVRDGLPALERIVVQDPAAGAGEGEPPVISWSDWLGRGREALARRAVAREVERRWESPEAGDDALLIYTSGSTGPPKGARISHRYLLASAASIRETLGLEAGDRTLSFLPYCHAAERVFGLYSRVLCGMEAGLVEDHRRLWEAARGFRPTLFGGLPRFFEKIHDGIREEGRSVSDYLGPDVRLATSGGAALKPAVVRGLRDAGLPVLGAYGVTEHLCVAFDRPDRRDLDTAGPPMPGSEVRTAEDGEILVRRGPLTFSGYLGRPEKTREAFTGDGEWLKTGDLGELDDDGFLRVTGRKKELLALSTGKKVSPLPVEERLAADPWIREAVVVGEGRKFVAALVVPRRERLAELASGAGRPDDPGSLAGHPMVRGRIQEAVDRVNRDLSRTERIRRFAVLERPLSAQAGELTPTGKIRRFRVVENHAALIDELYADPAGREGAHAGEEAS